MSRSTIRCWLLTCALEPPRVHLIHALSVAKKGEGKSNGSVIKRFCPACCGSSAQAKQDAEEGKAAITDAFAGHSEVVSLLMENAKVYLKGLAYWADLWEHGDTDPDMMYTNDRVAQTKIREINFTLTSAKRSLQWLTIKYGLNNAKVEWKGASTEPSGFREEDFSLVHNELMPRVREKALMETEARRRAEEQYAEEPKVGDDVLAAYACKYTSSLKSELLTRARFQSLELTQLFSDFDESQRTWEIAKLSAAWQDKSVLLDGAAVKNITEPDQQFGSFIGRDQRGNRPAKPRGDATVDIDREIGILASDLVDVSLANGEADDDSEDNTSGAPAELAARNVPSAPAPNGSGKRRTKLPTIEPLPRTKSSKNTVSTGSRHMLDLTLQDEEMLDSVLSKSRLRKDNAESQIDANFRRDALETKQVLELQTKAVNAAKDEMRNMIQDCNREQTQQLVRLLFSQHAQQMEQLREMKLDGEHQRAKETQMFARLQENLRAIDVKLDVINGEIKVVSEKVDEVSGKVDQVVVKLDEMDERLVKISAELEKVTWLQRIHNRIGTTMFIAILVLGVIILL
eukprot:g17.t1